MKRKFIKPLTTPARAPTPTLMRTSLDQSIPVVSQNTVQYTPALLVLPYDFSYLAVNTGQNPAIAFLQISPNNIIWETQTAMKVIPPNTMVTFVSSVIAKYAHLGYQSQQTDHSTSLTIYIQGR